MRRHDGCCGECAADSERAILALESRIWWIEIGLFIFGVGSILARCIQ